MFTLANVVGQIGDGTLMDVYSMPVALGVGRQASYVAGYVERRVLSSLLEG